MVLLASVVYWDARLYGEVGLHLFYFLLQLYGWFYWSRSSGQEESCPVTRLTAPAWGASLVWMVVLGATLSGFLGAYTNTDVPGLDGYTTGASLVAQFLMARKIRECWLWWIVVDVVYVGLYAFKGLEWFAALYVVYVVLACKGWLSWGTGKSKELG